jgi:hypothetical protein
MNEGAGKREWGMASAVHLGFGILRLPWKAAGGAEQCAEKPLCPFPVLDSRFPIPDSAFPALNP